MKVLRIQKWYINTSNILYILWKVNKPILPDYLLSAQNQTESLQGSPNDDVSRGSFIHFLQIIEGDLSKMLFSTNNIKLTVINLKICQWSHKVLFFKCIRWFFGSDILFVPRKCPFKVVRGSFMRHLANANVNVNNSCVYSLITAQISYSQKTVTSFLVLVFKVWRFFLIKFI